METSILAEAVLSPGIKLAPQTQTIWPTLAQFLGKVYDRHLASDEAKRVLFEPHRVMTPDDFYSTKCAGAGLYALLEQARHTATTGTNLPTEVTGCTVSYRVLEHGVPIYFVDE